MPLLPYRILTVLVFAYIATEVQTYQTQTKNGDHYGMRIERSLAAAGKAALEYLLKDAKFLYSDGFNTVFTKQGGLTKALADFEHVNTAKRVFNLPASGGYFIAKVGSVGDRKLMLKEGSEAVHSYLTIKRIPETGTGTHSGSESLFENTIVYIDK